MSSHPASSGGWESTASMPCRAITLYLFLGLAREAQGHGASQGPELLAVQRLYFNVYLLQNETAFGFEPLMRKKYIELKNNVCGVSLGQERGIHVTKQTGYTQNYTPSQNEKPVPGSIKSQFPLNSAACWGSRG